MMKNRLAKRVIWMALTLLFLASDSYAQNLNFNGYIRSYISALANEQMDYAIIQNTLDLRMSQGAGKVAFLANPYIYQYPNQELALGLREAYLDVFFANMDMRLGKQQIIWGKADGVFITDIISPKDLSEFLLREFEEIRVGVTALKADYYLADNTLEFVWIPTFTPTKMPDSASIWSRLPEFSLPVTFDYSQTEVPGRLENSEVFLKFSGMSSLLDYELIAGQMWDDDPTMHVTPDMVTGNPLPVGLTLTPQHHQLSLIGGSFSTDLAGYVIRGESAYYSGKQFVSNNALGLPTDVLGKNYLHYLVGTDFSIGSTRLSAQFIQMLMLDYEESILQDEQDNMMTFLANRTFLQETLTAQLFAYVGMNNQDALIRPTLAYDLTDGFEVLAGANIFTASDEDSETGAFGYYDNNDMIYLKVKYSF